MNTDSPQDMPTFDSLALAPVLLKAIAKSGYTTPTPIQAQAIPLALQGQDLLLSAQTGSGKTASFVLPILHELSQKKPLEKHIHALILTPTRELALQVYDSVRRYGANIRHLYSASLVGGSPYGEQIRNLKKGVQIVIATPGRLLDHINEGRVDLSKIQTLVLDEADRMLDMGFAEDIEAIVAQAPEGCQRILSSATWDGAVGKVAQEFTNNPAQVSIKVETDHIEESVYFCDDFHHKNKLLLSLLGDDEINQAVIFTATKRSSEQLTQTLTEAGLKACYLHGDLPQGKRNRIIKDIKSKKCDFLVATDVAARGIDISAISHVVNYDLPRQVEDYVHRIGRCGRAGRTGVALNLCSMDDRSQLRHIKHYLKRDIKEAVVEGLEPKRQPKEEMRQGKKGKGRFDKFKSDRPKFDRPKFGKKRHEQGEFDEQRTFDKPKFDKPKFDRPKFDKPRHDVEVSERFEERPKRHKPKDDLGVYERPTKKKRSVHELEREFERDFAKKDGADFSRKGGERPRRESGGRDFDKPKFDQSAKHRASREHTQKPKRAGGFDKGRQLYNGTAKKAKVSEQVFATPKKRRFGEMD